MSEEETKKKIIAGLEDLFLISKNLKTTGAFFLRVDLSDGIPRNYGYNIENKSCIRDGKTVR